MKQANIPVTPHTEFIMKRCLVTGGAGFIGSHLVEALLSHGHVVRVLDDLSTGRLEYLATVQERIDVQVGSVLDPTALALALRDIEWVFHLAAQRSIHRSVEAPLTAHATCATGTIQVLETARQMGIARVVYASSSSVYGNSPRVARREDDPLLPASPYAVAKLAGEHYCRVYAQVFGLPTVSLRLFNVFGSRQEGDSPYAVLIARALQALQAGRRPVVYGDGQQTRDFTYIENVVAAFMRAANLPNARGQAYNVGGGQEASVLDIITHLNRLLGMNLAPEFAPARPGEVRRACADLTKATTELGYVPPVSWQEGLRRLTETC